MNNNSENISPSICIVGNVMLDVVTSLHQVTLSEAGRFPTLLSPINFLAGGTAVIAALEASKAGFSTVSILGKIGGNQDYQPDLAGRIIAESLIKENIKIYFSQDNQKATGKTIIVYFSEDSRLLVADRGANNSFGIDDIDENLLKVVADADILFVSGFMLVVPEQAKAMMKLMEMARSHHRLIVLDVVPHSIYKSVSSNTFSEYTKHVNVLISEVSTLRHLFPVIETLDSVSHIEEISSHLISCYDSIILRTSNLYQFFYDKSGLIYKGETGYKENDREGQRGYLDSLAVQLIKKHYQRLATYL